MSLLQWVEEVLILWPKHSECDKFNNNDFFSDFDNFFLTTNKAKVRQTFRTVFFPDSSYDHGNKTFAKQFEKIDGANKETIAHMAGEILQDNKQDCDK